MMFARRRQDQVHHKALKAKAAAERQKEAKAAHAKSLEAPQAAAKPEAVKDGAKPSGTK